MESEQNNCTRSYSGAEADRRAMRRSGIYSASGIVIFLAVVCTVFYYEPGIVETPPRNVGRFRMFDIEDIEAAQPGFSAWLEAADPRNFVVPSNEDSCRDYHWQTIQAERRLPVENVSIVKKNPPGDIPLWTASSAGKKVVFPSGSWYSSASLPVPSVPVTQVIWEDGIAPCKWQPSGSLVNAAAAAGVEMTTVTFRLGGPFPGVTIDDAAADDLDWRTALARELLEAAKELDPADGRRRAVIYWAKPGDGGGS